MKIEAQPSRPASPRDTSGRHELVQAGRWLCERRLVLGTAGNLSLRLADGSFLVTPSSIDYRSMQAEDVVRLSPAGEPETDQPSTRQPTSEKALHLECLRRYPEIGAVVHSHAPRATAFAVAGSAIPCITEEMLAYLGGDVPIAEYYITGSEDLASEAARHLAERSAVLLAHHGLLTIGRDLEQALHATSLAERCATIALDAHSLGGCKALPESARPTLLAWYRQQRHGTSTDSPR